MRQVITIVLVLMLSVCTVIAADFDNNDVEPVHPEYAGIAQNLVNITLTSGSVKCSGMTIVKQNYYVSIVWKLQMTSSLNSNDFSTIETWTDNGFGFHTFGLEKYRAATHGHAYRLLEEINVYTSNGSFVERVNQASPVIRYS